MPRKDAPDVADVSVIVPAYQAAGTIRRTLESVAAQICKPREVVVVDDGSPDGTADAARACAPDMAGIALRVFRTDDNLGAGAARNRAIAESTQPVLAFLDADDEWLPEKLASSMAHLEEGDYVLVAHDYLTGDGPAERHHRCARRFRENTDPFVGLYRKGYIPSCSVVARREAVVAAGGFDEGLPNAQDFDLWLAMLREPGTPFLVFDEPLLRYHPAPGGIMSHTKRRLRCGLAIAQRYFPDLRSRPGSALASLWYRVVALHLEAVRAYGVKGEIFNLFLVAAMSPFNLVLATLRCLAGNGPPRGGDAAGATVAGEAKPTMTPTTALLWLWVIAATGAYLYQFRGFAQPILGLLGLA